MRFQFQNTTMERYYKSMRRILQLIIQHKLKPMYNHLCVLLYCSYENVC